MAAITICSDFGAPKIKGDFNTLLTPTDRSTKQINKKTQVLNDTLDEMDLIERVNS